MKQTKIISIPKCVPLSVIQEACKKHLKESPFLSDTPKDSFPYEDEFVRMTELSQLQSDGTLVKTFNDNRVFQSKSNSAYYVEKDNDLIFYCRINTVLVSNKHIPYISLIWKADILNSAFIDFFVWEVLYPLKQCFTSDKDQSTGGKKLWNKIISEALSKNLFVYSIENLKILKPISNISEVEFFYGTDLESQKYRFMVSKEAL